MHRRPPHSFLPVATCLLSLFLFPTAGAPQAPRCPPPDPFHGPMAAFLTARARPFWLPDRPVDLEHLVLDLRLDERTQTVSGSVTYTLRGVRPGLRSFTLDAGPDLQIREVTLDGRRVPYRHRGHRLDLALPEPLPRGHTARLYIAYRGQPHGGLFFVGPHLKMPGWSTQIWSQGAADANHLWFPTRDIPGEKFTVESHITVRPPLQAIGNGRLVAVRAAREPGWRTYIWSTPVPLPAYLVTVAAGEFQEIRDRWEDIPVMAYIPQEQPRSWGVRAFQSTPAILAFFSRRLGVRYPFAKYAHVAVYNFLYGGMENASATTVTVQTLRDARAAREGSSDRLVAHELAHQWFGDLVTPRNWPHAWLSEGFATYLTLVWVEHAEGADAFSVARYETLRSYLNESKRYRRPLTWRLATHAIDFYDRHSYAKAALVLHMLRRKLGEELFWSGLRAFLQRYAGDAATPWDLQATLERGTGVSLGAFFDQWVNHAGHPIVAIQHRWDPAEKLLRLRIQQVQQRDAWVPLFDLNTVLEVVTDRGRHRYPVHIHRSQHVFVFRLDARPRLLLLDPGRHLLMEQRWQKSTSEWAQQLLHAEAPADRLEAARALGPRRDDRARTALAHALKHDPVATVRMEAARALGRVADPQRVTVLLEARSDPDPGVRRAVVAALRDLPPTPTGRAQLARMYTHEPTYGVRAALIETLVRWDARHAWTWIERGLQTRSYREQIAAAALRSLLRTPETDRDRALRVLERYLKPGQPIPLRTTAMQVWARLAGDPARLHERLAVWLFDPLYRVRSTALRVLEQYRVANPEDLLQRFLEHEPVARLRTRALQMRASRTGAPTGRPGFLRQPHIR